MPLIAGHRCAVLGGAIRPASTLHGDVLWTDPRIVGATACFRRCTWDSESVTDSRDDLLTSLVAMSLDVRDVLPARVSSPVLQPPRAGLDWPAGVALQHILEAGIQSDDLVALIRQVRVRAVADAIGLIGQSMKWTICALADATHEPLSSLDTEFRFLADAKA
jgi:hypothetical protein